MLKKVQIFKALDVEIKKQKGPAAVKEPYRGYHSLKEELSQPGISIIAEVAGGNPLRGQVRDGYRASTHAKSLIENGARALSVATDRFLFFGEDRHLPDVRPVVKVPIIRRDFIFEEYQIEESKILGADAVFLMAALLEPERLKALNKLAISKGLDVVIEVTSEADIKRALDAEAEIVCVVGRDLDTWEPSWEGAIQLVHKVPEKKCLRMVEASISSLEQIKRLEDMGVHGVVVGDALLDEFYPGKRLAQILSGMEIPKKPLKGKAKSEQAGPGASVETEGIPSEEGEPEASLTTQTATPSSSRKGKKELPMVHTKKTGEAKAAASSSSESSSKKPVAKKAAPPKVEPKKVEPKKVVAEKPAAKKAAPAKKAEPKKAEKAPAVQKAAPKKAVPEKKAAPVKKVEPKKAEKVEKKPVVQKAEPKKAAAPKPAVKKVAEKPVAKKAAPAKAEPKKVEKKPAPAPKAAAPKAAPAKAVAKKAVEPKKVEAKAPVKKTPAPKAPAKKK